MSACEGPDCTHHSHDALNRAEQRSKPETIGKSKLYTSREKARRRKKRERQNRKAARNGK